MPEHSAFDITRHLVDSILLLAITDSHFLKMVRNAVRPENLPGEIAPQVLKVVYDYYDRAAIKVAPKDYFQDEIKGALKKGLIRKDDEDRLLAYVKQLSELGSVNKDYVVGKLNRFVQQRDYIEFLTEAIHRTRRSDMEGAKLLIMQAIKSGVGEYRTGMEFFDPESIRERGIWYEQQADFLMSFGIEPFDKLGVYLQRKYFIIIMGREKKGKTWGGLHFGRIALLHGLNVLHVTHESGITERKLAERYEMNMAGVGAAYKDAGWRHQTPILTKLAEGRFRLESKEIAPGTVRDRDKVIGSLKGMKAWGGRLIIKEFARGSCSMGQLESYIDSLEVAEDFIPDVIINDYPDIMKLPRGEYRHSIDYIYQEHSRLASERNCLVVGFSQVKAAAYGKKYVTMADFAEDKRKAAHCDGAFALCQTSEEETKGRVRFVWVLDRNFGMERKQAGLLQDYAIGQFCKKAYAMDDIEGGEEENGN